MKRLKKTVIIEILACLLLLACFLYVSVSQNRSEKENIQKAEETNIQKEQVFTVETEDEEKNLTNISEEDMKNTEREISVLTENPNPYFFPDDVMTVMYDCNREHVPEEKADEKIKILICKEIAFPKGILYSLKGEKLSENGDDGQENKDFIPRYFYVQADRIYLIRDMEISQDITEKDLIEAGTIICQPNSKAEDEETRNVLGPHEMIKTADGKSAFYGHYDNRDAEDSYEYFIWQMGKGLIEYRSGHLEVEDVGIRMEGVEKTGFGDENTFNPYFFAEDKTVIKYEGQFELDGIVSETGELDWRGRTDVELSVEKEKVLENGILYRMDIVNEGKFYFSDDETGRRDEKRMHLGYFYVQADKIYLIRDMEIDLDITEKELIDAGKIVCQPEPRGDIIDPEEKGLHEGIGILGDECVFGRYSNYIETDWWESFIWQKGLGLVEYKSGRGALADMVYITIKP